MAKKTIATKQDIVFKVRRKSDGFFLKRGYGSFSKKGSSFSSLGMALSSLKCKSSITKEQYLELEIVEYGEIKSYSSAFIIDKLVE